MMLVKGKVRSGERLTEKIRYDRGVGMADIRDFRKKSTNRKNYMFKNRPVIIKRDARTFSFPCIALYRQVSEELWLPSGFPQFERWYIGLDYADKSEITMNKKAYNICCFLNYLLWETHIEQISDVTVPTLRNFYASARFDRNGKQRAPGEWNRLAEDVSKFLINYHKRNADSFPFKYHPQELIKKGLVRNMKNEKIQIDQVNKLGVKPPRKNQVKNRYLLEEYLPIILFEAKKYDPMLVLPIMLQAYSGLREGEVVNVTRERIKIIDGGFGIVRSIRIDLRHEADFAKAYKGKTPFGAIKVHRIQDIYTDFVQDVYKELDNHERLLRSRGISVVNDGPLFFNEYGKPMNVSCYCNRVKKLFKECFLPALIKLSDREGTWAKHAPFYEKWVDSIDPDTLERIAGEYPGAHMFRHWFTMYLITRTSMRVEEVAKWRGDSNITSMSDYIHTNREMLDLYKKYSFRYQESLLREVLDD